MTDVFFKQTLAALCLKLLGWTVNLAQRLRHFVGSSGKITFLLHDSLAAAWTTYSECDSEHVCLTPESADCPGINRLLSHVTNQNHFGNSIILNSYSLRNVLLLNFNTGPFTGSFFNRHYNSNETKQKRGGGGGGQVHLVRRWASIVTPKVKGSDELTRNNN